LFLALFIAAFVSGIIYYNPLASIDRERSVYRFKYEAPKSMGRNLLEYLANPLLSPAFRNEFSDDNDIVQYFLRCLMLELPSAKNANAFVNSILSSQNPILQTASLEMLKEKYLGYTLTENARSHYAIIVEKIVKSKKMRGAIHEKQIKRSRNLLDIKKNLSKSGE